MKESPFPLETSLGLTYYISDTPGTGGTLKKEPEDFVVEEIPIRTPHKEGSYLICRVTMKNWEQQHAVKEIANRLGISHRRIGWAGTKDKRALTTQYLSMYKVSTEQVASLSIKDITFEPVGFADQQLYLGDLKGNKFRICIRNILPGTGASVDDTMEQCNSGIPNYYGIQRFGVVRPVTHKVGYALLEGNAEEAVNRYIGAPSEGEHEDTQRGRSLWDSTHDAKETLTDYPFYLRYERAMLSHLAGSPGDYAGALQSLPPKLLSMFVSAVQSHLFNRALSERLTEGGTLTDVLPGDHLIFANGRTDLATARNAKTASVHVKRGRAQIAIMMPGVKEYPQAGGSLMDNIMAGLLEKEGITQDGFVRAEQRTGITYAGALRAISLQPDIEAHVINDEDGMELIDLSFNLPKGCYATTVCREIMKADPRSMI